MNLELATAEDNMGDLLRRNMRFVFAGITPSNRKEVTVQVGGAGKDTTELLRQLRLGRSVLEESRARERGNSGDGKP